MTGGILNFCGTVILSWPYDKVSATADDDSFILIHFISHSFAGSCSLAFYSARISQCYRQSMACVY